jgi:uncharacterized protein YkwD
VSANRVSECNRAGLPVRKIDEIACLQMTCGFAERSLCCYFFKRNMEEFHVISSVLAICASIALTGEPNNSGVHQPKAAAATATATAKAPTAAPAKAPAVKAPAAKAPAATTAAAKAPTAKKGTEGPTVHTVNRPITANASYKFFPIELAIVEKTNAERVRNGLPPLQLDPKLVDTARRHTWWMTCSHSLQHGSYPVAENIAMGQRSSQEVVTCWMNSSGHRANILNRGHRRIGVAAYTTSSGTTYWCQQFTQ